MPMPGAVATKPQPRAKPVSEPRSILKPAGNRQVAVCDELKAKKEEERPRKEEVESKCSSDKGSSERRVKQKVRVRFVPDAVDVAAATLSPPIPTLKPSGPPKRCDWITPRADPLYTAFHDEEWGVPVYDDTKLFELLVFSQSLAEHSWPAILSQRHIFRKLFEYFEPSSIAQFTDKKLLALKINGSRLLSEPKLRAIVENAKQLLKLQREFGSFSYYCWRFVNHKQLRNEFRYGRQVPVKSPKAEVISKDMIRRGFQCVGPTVVYSFMQVAGLVNDHLTTCFRHHECNVATICSEFKTLVKEEEKIHGTE